MEFVDIGYLFKRFCPLKHLQEAVKLGVGLSSVFLEVLGVDHVGIGHAVKQVTSGLHSVEVEGRVFAIDEASEDIEKLGSVIFAVHDSGDAEGLPDVVEEVFHLHEVIIQPCFLQERFGCQVRICD